MTAMETQWHLKDCPFYGVCKHIFNLVQYLYSAPDTSYLQLMVTTRKVESENEETQENVRARAMVISNLGEGMAELSQQISKLMAALTQTGQGRSPSSTLGSPLEHSCGLGNGGRSTPSHPNSHSGRGGPGQTTPAHSLPMEQGVEETGIWGSHQDNCRPNPRGGCSWTLRPTLFPVF